VPNVLIFKLDLDSIKEAQPKWAIIMFCCCLFIFNDFCQTNYQNIYRTDLYPICSDGRTMPVDEQCEVSFFQSVEDVVVATDFVGNTKSTWKKYM